MASSGRPFTGNTGPGGGGNTGPGQGGNFSPGKGPTVPNVPYKPFAAAPAAAVTPVRALAALRLPPQALAVVGAFALGWAIGSGLVQLWGAINGPKRGNGNGQPADPAYEGATITGQISADGLTDYRISNNVSQHSNFPPGLFYCTARAPVSLGDRVPVAPLRLYGLRVVQGSEHPCGGVSGWRLERATNEAKTNWEEIAWAARPGGVTAWSYTANFTSVSGTPVPAGSAPSGGGSSGSESVTVELSAATPTTT